MNDKLTKVRLQRNALLDVLFRIRQWDMLDACADGPYWKSEIDKALNAALPSHEAAMNDPQVRAWVEAMRPNGDPRFD